MIGITKNLFLVVFVNKFFSVWLIDCCAFSKVYFKVLRETVLNKLT